MILGMIGLVGLLVKYIDGLLSGVLGGLLRILGSMVISLDTEKDLDESDLDRSVSSRCCSALKIPMVGTVRIGNSEIEDNNE